MGKHRRSILTAATIVIFGLAVGAALAGGALDRSFGDNGVVTTNFGEAGGASAFGVVIDSHGRIVTGGTIGGGSQMMVSRFKSSGVPDEAFSGDGWAASSFADSGWAWDVAIDHRGRAIAAGYGSENPAAQGGFALARFRPDGSPDRSFSGNGRLITPLLRLSEVHAVTVDRAGRIVAVGYAKRYEDPVFAVARYKPDGTLDRSFSHNGKLLAAVGQAGGQAYGVAIDARGRIVVAGFAHGVVGRRYEVAVLRLNSDGSRDKSFSQDAKVITAVGKSNSYASGVAIDAQGRITVVSNSPYLSMARYLPNGRLDRSFSGNGKVTPSSSELTAIAVALDSSQRIVVAGYGQINGTAFELARFKRNGALDQSFAPVTAIGTASSSANDLAIDHRGRIVAAGNAFEGGEEALAIARYIARGLLAHR